MAIFVVAILFHTSNLAGDLQFVDLSPNTTENQVEKVINCNPNWQCTGWNPKKCPRQKIQKRICTDVNSCDNEFNKPPQQQNCIFERNEKLVFIMATISGFLFLIILSIIVFFSVKKGSEDYARNTSVLVTNKTDIIPRFNPK